jgi:hypothetical protein
VAKAKTELGCEGADSCKAFCQKEENKDACFAFAVKVGLAKKEDAPKKITSAILNTARKELGCVDESSCRTLCAKSENQDKCVSWGRKQKILDEAPKESQAAREKFLASAKSELGCDSYNSCSNMCKLKENAGTCTAFYNKYVKKTSDQKAESNSESMKTSNPGGCETEQACREYCAAHTSECLGFGTKNMKFPSVTPRANETPAPSESKTYLGPGGCKTEDECRAYCQSHLSECPGFPKPTIVPSITKTPERETEDENETEDTHEEVTKTPTPTKQISTNSGSSPSNTPPPLP